MRLLYYNKNEQKQNILYYMLSIHEQPYPMTHLILVTLEKLLRIVSSQNRSSNQFHEQEFNQISMVSQDLAETTTDMRLIYFY